MADQPSPNVYVVAGPNGAGKSTFARLYLPDYADCKEFVNADLIAAGLSPFNPESLAIQAGRLMLERIEALAEARVDFGFETTLAGRGYTSLFRRLKDTGYRVHLFFLWLPSLEMALARVHERVLAGGHSVPDDVVRRRFSRGLSNLFRLYAPLLDSWLILDTADWSPRIVSLCLDTDRFVLDPETFDRIEQEATSS
jgi:predicted ABC-type ATPase